MTRSKTFADFERQQDGAPTKPIGVACECGEEDHARWCPVAVHDAREADEALTMHTTTLPVVGRMGPELDTRGLLRAARRRAGK